MLCLRYWLCHEYHRQNNKIPNKRLELKLVTSLGSIVEKPKQWNIF